MLFSSCKAGGGELAFVFLLWLSPLVGCFSVFVCVSLLLFGSTDAVSSPFLLNA